MQTYLKDTEATEEFGKKLWAALPARCVVYLLGNLGAGKTTLVRGFLRGAGYEGAVKSPTFTLVEEYTLNDRKVFHFDLYRLSDPEELEWIGINDYFDQNSICFIEWPDKGEGFLPVPDKIISLQNEGLGRILVMEEGVTKTAY